MCTNTVLPPFFLPPPVRCLASKIAGQHRRRLKRRTAPHCHVSTFIIEGARRGARRLLRSNTCARMACRSAWEGRRSDRRPSHRRGRVGWAKKGTTTSTTGVTPLHITIITTQRPTQTPSGTVPRSTSGKTPNPRCHPPSPPPPAAPCDSTSTSTTNQGDQRRHGGRPLVARRRHPVTAAQPVARSLRSGRRRWLQQGGQRGGRRRGHSVRGG